MTHLRDTILPEFESADFLHVHSHGKHGSLPGNDLADSLASDARIRVDPDADGYRLCARHVPEFVPLPAARVAASGGHPAGGAAGATAAAGGPTGAPAATATAAGIPDTDVGGMAAQSEWDWLAALPDEETVTTQATINSLPARSAEAFGRCWARVHALLEASHPCAIKLLACLPQMLLLPLGRTGQGARRAFL
eukprot:SAG31_NODE_9246_length_1308_cov_3.149711_1_plen_193_part_10